MIRYYLFKNLNLIRTGSTTGLQKGTPLVPSAGRAKSIWFKWVVLGFFMLCFFMFQIQNVSALWGIKGLCESVFRKNTIFFSSYDFKNPLSKTLVESYWLSHHLKFFTDQNKRQIKKWEKGLKEMVEILEHTPSLASGRMPTVATASLKQESSRSNGHRLQQLNISMETVINKIPQIIEFARKSSPEEALSHRQTAQAVMAVFAKILPTALKEQDPRQVHWNRIHVILKEIENFDGKDGLSNPFALYKINRAIEKWYSIKEFIRCKV